jgi:hypothetical protein
MMLRHLQQVVLMWRRSKQEKLWNSRILSRISVGIALMVGILALEKELIFLDDYNYMRKIYCEINS